MSTEETKSKSATVLTAAGINGFEEYLKNRKSPLTVTLYVSVIKKYLDFLKNQEPSSFTVQAFMSVQSARGLNARSMNLYLSALKKYFRFLERGSELERLESYRVIRRIPEWLNKEEADKYIAAAHPGYERAVAITFIHSGIRLSELCSMTLDNVMPDRGTGKGFLKVLGKGGKERIVPVPVIVMTAIGDYLETREDFDPRVFPRSERRVEEDIAVIGRRAKLKRHVHPHMLRHTFASQYAASGGNIVHLKEILGHTSLTTTTIYTHAAPEEIMKRLPV